MSENADYDTSWKEALSEDFEQFLNFFFPDIHKLIDWQQTPESLDKELQQITASSELGSCVADKLFKVWRTSGEETWILVHIEIQSQEQIEFAQRMYIYNPHSALHYLNYLKIL